MLKFFVLCFFVQDEFLEQMDRVKSSFREEQQQLEKQVEMLQEELNDINRTRDMEERYVRLGVKGREVRVIFGRKISPFLMEESYTAGLILEEMYVWSKVVWRKIRCGKLYR